MRKALFATLLVIGVAFASLWLVSEVRPVAWQPDADPGLNGLYEQNNKLVENDNKQRQRLILNGFGKGPEDIVIGDDGYLYTGYEDGRIVRVLLKDVMAGEHDEANASLSPELFFNTQGRPLGLKFDAAGNLIVADAIKGLISIDKQGKMQVLVTEFDGEKLLLIDHLAIAKDGTIWFSDASARFDLHDFVYDFLEASATGRLFSYEPSTKKTALKMDGLFFANGVALGPDDAFVLVNETGTAKIHRLWLKGDKAGTRDIFLANLPAMPDNISYQDGIFWVSLVALRDPLVEGFAQNTIMRRLIGGVPKTFLKASSHYGFVIGVSPFGEIIYNLQSSTGYQSITTAIEHEGLLFLGSLDNDSIGISNIK